MAGRGNAVCRSQYLHGSRRCPYNHRHDEDKACQQSRSTADIDNGWRISFMEIQAEERLEDTDDMTPFAVGELAAAPISLTRHKVKIPRLQNPALIVAQIQRVQQVPHC